MAEELTVLDVVRKSTDFLDKKGVESPRLNAEWLIAHALGLGRMDLYLQFDRPLIGEELEQMRALVARRGKREPLQYIQGQAQFHDLMLKCDTRALIPRPETEQLVEFVKDSGLEIDQNLRILDLGTGTGAIALALAMNFPRARIVATDASQNALDLASENALLCGLQNRVEFRLSNWFGSLGGEKRFDLIVSNPPYLTDEEFAEAESEVKDFEPESALVANDEGMADLRVIISGSYPLLEKSGTLWLETGIAQREALLGSCREVGYADSEGLDDWSGRPRFIRAIK
ncbi:MAG: peptide chain release factor N(5)-glutamine methyltransferase [Opitutales bacterium]|jgi:release factor glutamine methyltransferase|nr:peptide chain release factor N(5)-glutamine methyltransferase [Opitutales bacterium]MDG2254862.1 peptide chain release factor N(5)-glutamine methyltransferase [Opitutaceae bacterium]MBT5169207.1 peptide chain release factor N(5)-glutamine methyltransferase [Opitutales bacterium]MBT5815256.1 peptide chain release factor N(5)-glutamine methyltransferase [Opitutales bacterium]MBT6379208.1 peptide chain release factor N(5)-glutamine methyltransferase [Opitutales bacterium]